MRQAISEGCGRAARLVDRLGDGFRVVAVDRADMPAGGGEAGRLVHRRGERGRPVDGDRLSSKSTISAIEPQMAGQIDRLVADAFHEAAVAGDHVGVVVDEVGAEAGGEHALGERHADGVRETLAERAGCRLDAERMAVFRMPGGAEPELAEPLQLARSSCPRSRQMEQRV